MRQPDGRFIIDSLSSQGLFSTSQKIILVEDLPFLSDVAKSDEFRKIIRDFLSTTKYPLVFILSDTYPVKFKKERITVTFRDIWEILLLGQCLLTIFWNLRM